MDEIESTSSESLSKEKVNKRRSAVFTRQSIVPKQQDFESTEEISQESKKFKHSEDESEASDIKKYIESLAEEDTKWREEYAKRKSRVQELVKRNKSQEQAKQALDITALSDSERAFLRAKPDYEEFNKNVFQLHALATKVTFLKLSSENFYEKSRLKVQNETDNIKKRIIDLSD